MKFPDNFVNEFENYLNENNKMLPTPILGKDQQIEDFRKSINFVEEAFTQKKINGWSAEELVIFIQKLHEKVAHSVYQIKSIRHPAGSFRQDISVVLRHPPQKSPYRAANEPGKITAYLKSQFGPKVALDFLIGYLKFYILPTEDQKLQNVIIKFAQDHCLKFDSSRFSVPLTEDENFALDRIYKIFIPHQQIEQALLQWASELLDALNKKKDPVEIFATYYLRFIEIHPFADANSRVAKILLNAILIELGYQPSLFGNRESKFFYEHFYNKGSPNPKDFVQHLRQMVVPSPSLNNNIEDSFEPTDRFSFYLSDVKLRCVIWEQLKSDFSVSKEQEVASSLNTKIT